MGECARSYEGRREQRGGRKRNTENQHMTKVSGGDSTSSSRKQGAGERASGRRVHAEGCIASIAAAGGRKPQRAPWRGQFADRAVPAQGCALVPGMRAAQVVRGGEITECEWCGVWC